MIRFVNLLVSLLISITSVEYLCSQGLLIDESIYEQLPRQSLYGDGGKSETTALEGIYKIDLKPFCPKPKKQGNIGSCTGWATGYGAMSIAYAINLTKNQNDSAFSALFLYNQAREEVNDCRAGSYIHKALDILKEKGNLKNSLYDKGNDCKRMPTAEELELARIYKIKDWLTLFGASSSNRIRIDKTKLSLADNKPVVIAMRLRNNFMELGSKDNFWLPSIGDTALNFIHAMVVVGFDDGKGAFEVMNSWGEEWGDKGFFWIRYEDYARHVLEAYQMTIYPENKEDKIVNDNSSTKTQLRANFTIRYVKEIKDTTVIFETASFLYYNNGIYEMKIKDWHIGKLYQVIATNLTGGSYLYVFSVDAENNIKIHWPRDSKLDEKFEGLNESSIVTNSKVQLIIPNPETAMVLEKEGDEYVCILLSKDPLPNINPIIQQIRKNTAWPIRERIRQALGSLEIKPGVISFSKNDIQFSTSDQKGKVVLTLLKIPVSSN